MADKCASCGGVLEEVFLDKIDGTYLRDRKGKKRAVCAVCQSKHSIDDLRAKL
ncbi:TPA: hypothetical protein HA251_05010 [Candidatus Woesearchaeota archaeon]|nr:hypothetical protein [Candidatus Woesearchaeota archaeon]